MSLLIHGWLLSALPISSPSPIDNFSPASAPIMVRIAPTPDPLSDVPRTPEPEEQRAPSTVTPTPRRAEDSRYYLAQELDSYPRPLTPLRFGRPAGDSAAEVLLEILVDERGVVQDVILARPSQSGRASEELRALLAATHFMPARRDGRAVRSRLTLRVRIDREDGER